MTHLLAIRIPHRVIAAILYVWPLSSAFAQTDHPTSLGPVATSAALTLDTLPRVHAPAARSASRADTSARPASGVPRDTGVRATDGVDPVTAAARDYERTGIARTVESGEFITYPYGHGQPTVTCAPLRACVIELDAGETVLSRIAGDTQRWEIELAPAGRDGRTPLVVVKPHDCALTTNLVLSTTAGRIYDLTLDSPPCPRGGSNPHGVYVRHVRFYYPDSTVAVWSVPPTPPPVLGPASDHATASARAETFNFAYHIERGRRFPWTPLAVFDDGVHCYIKLPPRAAQRDTPVLFQIADDGTRMLLNYSLNNDTFVTDRVFRAGMLIIGEGAAEHVLRVDNMKFDAISDGEASAATARGSAPGPTAVSP